MTDRRRDGIEGAVHEDVPPVTGRAAVLLDRFSRARVGRLGTVGETGRPHLVPVTFAVRGTTVALAVDSKPKKTTRLQRIRNIRVNPSVAILVDEYDDTDWSALWWVRLDGTARILESGGPRAELVGWLVEKYPQYKREPPHGPVVRVDVTTVRGWAAME